MSANGIAHLANKKLRQEAKLALAGQDRQDRNAVQPGRYSDTSADISQLPTKYKADNSLENNINIVGGVITSISVTTPVYRTDGGPYNPSTTTVEFSIPLDFSINPAGDPIPGSIRATGTPVFNASNQLSGITLIQGGLGYQKRKNVPEDSPIWNQVLCDIMIIDSKPGSPDSREMRDVVLGLAVDASDSTYGLLPGRPWA